MPKSTKTKSAKNRVKVGKLPTRAKNLTTKEAKKVKGGIIAILIGRTEKPPVSTNLMTSGNTVGGSLGSISGNTIGGSLSVDPSNPNKP